MVLWEITAITAYFLGLKRTYKLALRIQRRVIPADYPRIRDFVYRRTRDVFNVAITVHKNIQDRDLEAGRNLGNMILRWLDRMKPSAQIRPHPELTAGTQKIRQTPSTSLPPGTEKIRNIPSTTVSLGAQQAKPPSKESNGKLLFSSLNSLNFRSRAFPAISMMMHPARSAGLFSQSRPLTSLPLYIPAASKRRHSLEGIFRKDIAHIISR